MSEPELVVVSADEQRDAGQLAEALPATLPPDAGQYHESEP